MISVHYQLQQGTFHSIGMIGYSNGLSTNLKNIIIQMLIFQNKGLNIGAIAGILNSKNWYAQNITVENSYLTGTLQLGLFAALTSTGSINQSIFTSSNIFASDANDTVQGGVIGATSNLLNVQSCYVYNISLFSNNSFKWSVSGGLVGDTHQFPATILFCTIKQIDIKSFGGNVFASSGGLVACQYDSTLLVQEIQIINQSLVTQSPSSAYCAGLISYIRNQIITVTNTRILSVSLISQGQYVYIGIVFSNDGAIQYTFDNTITDGLNYINGVNVSICHNVVNQSQNGC
ncbi:Hypothetical_protein [Hexamita inflata]|uniref:Hypothetical_protein n=1 Tax=Hexamita inflata TaxID=28002 RepID=A0AA86NYM4_9EUKA|nr:Hypothetical protein HINF_LOCUS15245 [Hexamita inflata]